MKYVDIVRYRHSSGSQRFHKGRLPASVPPDESVAIAVIQNDLRFVQHDGPLVLEGEVLHVDIARARIYALFGCGKGADGALLC
mmetsp:Transcript_26767/g.39911  ORF Transcript_26767/g.39911 Transcript_26767/m.39911 type:complete len:84 (+) Transcript_26767:2259-2510(+)